MTEGASADSRNRWAAIDIGTNSVLLTIAERRGGDLFPVVEIAEITRLGEGVAAARSLAPAARARTLACLARYSDIVRTHGVTALDVVGTSAMRDARGGGEFADDAARVLGVRPRVISGREEAMLTFRGALSGLDGLSQAPITVFDIGGGSTEIIHGDERGQVRFASSLDLGSVRLFERHGQYDPPGREAVERASAEVRTELAALEPPTPGARLVGVAGTVTTLAAIRSELAVYDGATVHGARLTAKEVDGLAARLAALDVRTRTELPGLEPKRADVIVFGAVLAAEVLKWARCGELVVSDRGVRWGLVMALADEL